MTFLFRMGTTCWNSQQRWWTQQILRTKPTRKSLVRTNHLDESHVAETPTLTLNWVPLWWVLLLYWYKLAHIHKAGGPCKHSGQRACMGYSQVTNPSRKTSHQVRMMPMLETQTAACNKQYADANLSRFTTPAKLTWIWVTKCTLVRNFQMPKALNAQQCQCWELLVWILAVTQCRSVMQHMLVIKILTHFNPGYLHHLTSRVKPSPITVSTWWCANHISGQNSWTRLRAL